MAGNALELLQMSCFCESLVIWKKYRMSIKEMKDLCENGHLMDVAQK